MKAKAAVIADAIAVATDAIAATVNVKKNKHRRVYIRNFQDPAMMQDSFYHKK